MIRFNWGKKTTGVCSKSLDPSSRPFPSRNNKKSWQNLTWITLANSCRVSCTWRAELHWCPRTDTVNLTFSIAPGPKTPAMMILLLLLFSRSLFVVEVFVFSWLLFSLLLQSQLFCFISASAIIVKGNSAMSVFILLVRISLHAHHRASSSPPLPRRRLFFFFFHLLPPNRYFRSIFGDVGGFRALDIEWSQVEKVSTVRLWPRRQWGPVLGGGCEEKVAISSLFSAI